MTQTDEAVTREDLIHYMEQGSKPKAQWCCGTEYEKFAYRKSDLKPLTYNGAQGLEALLTEFHQRFGWQPQREDGHIVGLKSPEGLPKASITTEPAGQVELSGSIYANVHQNRRGAGFIQGANGRSRQEPRHWVFGHRLCARVEARRYESHS